MGVRRAPEAQGPSLTSSLRSERAGDSIARAKRHKSLPSASWASIQWTEMDTLVRGQQTAGGKRNCVCAHGKDRHASSVGWKHRTA